MSETYEVNIIVNGKDNASGPLSGVNSALGNIGTVVAGILTSQVIMKLGQQLWDFGKSVFDSASESQLAVADLEATLKSTQGVAGITSQAAQDLANSLQGVTRFSDETILKGESMLLTFTNIGKDVFPTATEAMLNLATKMGGDASQAAIQLGKALNDPIQGVTALRRVGVQLTDAQEAQIKKFVEMGDIESAQKIILGELQTEFGGLARAMGQTAAGKMDILANKWDNLKERLGGPLLAEGGGLSKLLDVVNGLVDSPAFGNFVDNLGQGISDIVAAFAEGMQSILAMKDALKNLGNNQSVRNIGKTLSAAFAVFTQPAIKNSINQMFEGIKRFFSDLSVKVMPFANDMIIKFGNWFTANGPLIARYVQMIADNFTNYLLPALLVAWDVIAPLLEGLLDLILNLATLTMQIATGDWAGAWETIKNIVYGVGTAILQSLSALFEGIARMMGTSLKEIGKVWSNNWKQLKEIGSKVWNIITTTVEKWLKDIWKKIVDFFSKIGKTWSDNWKQLNEIAQKLWDIIVQTLRDKLADFYNIGANMITRIRDGLNAAWSGFWSYITGLYNNITSAFSGAAAYFYDLGTQIINQIYNGIVYMWDTFWTYISGVYTNITNAFADTATYFYGIGTSIINKISEGVTYVWTTFYSWFYGKYQSVVGVFSNIAATFYSIGKSIIEQITAGISDVWDDFWDWFNELYEKIINIGSGEIFSGLGAGLGANMAQSVMDGLTSGLKGSNLTANLGMAAQGVSSYQNNSTNASRNYYAPVTFQVTGSDPELSDLLGMLRTR